MSLADVLTRANQAYQGRHRSIESAVPRRGLAVLTCMDARIDPFQVLGLEPGDAHILRNAGGRVTDDVLRSLAVSQQAMDTRTIFLVWHTRCGAIGLDPNTIRGPLGGDQLPPMAFYPIADLESDLKADMARLQSSPWVAANAEIMGAIFDIESGALHWVSHKS